MSPNPPPSCSWALASLVWDGWGERKREASKKLVSFSSHPPRLIAGIFLHEGGPCLTPLSFSAHYNKADVLDAKDKCVDSGTNYQRSSYC